MGVWQIIYIALMIIGLCCAAGYHGKPRPNYNFWSILFSTGLELFILWKGGFFS